MLRTTVGQLLVNDALPAHMRDYNRTMDSATVSGLLQKVAEESPEQYSQVLKKLTAAGRHISYASGAFSFGPQHLLEPQSSKDTKQRLRDALEKILDNEEDDEDTKQKKIITTVFNEQKPREDAIMKETEATGNPLWQQVRSGARGKPMNLKSLLESDYLYTDHRDNVIPVPVLRSYSQGLTPAEYFAGAFGARKGVVDVKLCASWDTRVRMADWSVKLISEIKVGEYVLGCDRSGFTFPSRVNHVFDNGERECFRYRFSAQSNPNAATLDATPDHKILAKLKLGRTVKRSVYEPTPLPLRHGRKDFVAVPAGPYVGKAGRSEKYALAIGLTLGNGCLSPSAVSKGSLLYSNADDSLVEDTREYFAGLGLQMCLGSQKPNYIITALTPDGLAHVGQKDRRYREFKRKLGSIGLMGKYSHEKTIPDDVDSWDQLSVLALLSGLFAADGCVSPSKDPRRLPSVKYDSTSRQLIDAVVRLLRLRLGIYVHNVTEHPVEGRQFAKHPLYTIAICGRQQITTLCDSLNIPGSKGRLLRKTLASLPAPKQIKDNGFSYKIKQAIGKVHTFDLEVDHPDHLFVLENGLVISNSVANSGYLGKLLVQAAHRLLVTKLDGPYDENNPRGLPIDTDDSESVGALLAAAVGGYPRNTVITPKVLKDIQTQGIKRMLIRSPIVGGPPEGGLYARDVGVRERGGLAPVGDMVGIAAAQSLSEPISQGGLSSKHSGGVAGASKVSGFKTIEQMVQIPKTFQGGAAHSEEDGYVDRIEDAPAGGKLIFINGKEHYAPLGAEIKVKPGDLVEAGDLLSDGIPNPDKMVMHKGQGEGSRLYVQAMKNVLKEAGINANRRNIELVTRGLINHVRIEDEMDDYIPGDIVQYDRLEANWQPRPGFEKSPVSPSLVGKYLERPVLHYSIGTKIRPSVLRTLDEFGVKNVEVHNDPPPFRPEMQRGLDNLSADPDPITSMLGSNLQKNLLKNVARGAVADPFGTSYVPALVFPNTFGRKGLVRPFDPKQTKNL